MKTCCLFLLLAAVLTAACDDFFEKDISGRRIELAVPADSVETAYHVQTFLWYELPGASHYRLLLVTPSFQRPEACLLDTLVGGCSFTFELQPGRYAWRVGAVNSAWASGFSERTLTVLPETAKL